MTDFAELLHRQQRVYRLDQALACGVSAHRIAADVTAGDEREGESARREAE